MADFFSKVDLDNYATINDGGTLRLFSKVGLEAGTETTGLKVVAADDRTISVPNKDLVKIGIRITAVGSNASAFLKDGAPSGVTYSGFNAFTEFGGSATGTEYGRSVFSNNWGNGQISDTITLTYPESIATVIIKFGAVNDVDTETLTWNWRILDVGTGGTIYISDNITTGVWTTTGAGGFEFDRDETITGEFASGLAQVYNT